MDKIAQLLGAPDVNNHEDFDSINYRYRFSVRNKRYQVRIEKLKNDNVILADLVDGSLYIGLGEYEWIGRSVWDEECCTVRLRDQEDAKERLYIAVKEAYDNL